MHLIIVGTMERGQNEIDRTVRLIGVRDVNRATLLESHRGTIDMTSTHLDSSTINNYGGTIVTRSSD